MARLMDTDSNTSASSFPGLRSAEKAFIRDFSFLFSRPYKVQLDITNNCNLDCVYCYNSARKLSTENEMSDLQLQMVATKIRDQLNPLIVSFSGGEPLFRRQALVTCIEILKERDIEVWINTNGLLIDNEIATRFKDLEVNRVNVNIESLNHRVHDRLRGQAGAFEQLMNKLQLLEDAVGSPKISISVVVNRLNLYGLVDLARFVERKNFLDLHLLDMIPTINNARELALDAPEWSIFFKLFSEIRQIGIRITPNHALLFMQDFNRDFVFPFCMAGRLKFVICANGDIVPCDYFKSTQFICGNALSDDLKLVWSSSKVLKRFRYSLEGYDDCEDCGCLKKCAGGCKALSYAFFGDPFMPDPYCKFFGLRNV